MTGFDIKQAVQNRAAFPHLTVFDTGEMLEPKLHHRGTSTEGSVDFDNDESATVLTVFAHPSAIDEDTTVIQIDTIAGGRYKVMLNDGVIYFGDPEREAEDAGICSTCWGIIPPEGVMMVPEDGDVCDCAPSAYVEK